MAKIALPELKKRGYDQMVSLGSLAGAGTLGILIPPSIMMVIYAVQANVSIIQVFLAGFIPGLIVQPASVWSALFLGAPTTFSLWVMNPMLPALPNSDACFCRESARSGCGESGDGFRTGLFPSVSIA